MRKALFMSYAIAAYLVGTAGLVALIVFLSGWMPGFSVNHGVVRPAPQALLIDCALMLLWTLQHIGMARWGFKTRLQRWLPEALERSNYVMFSGLSLWFVLLAWSPMPAPLFALTDPWIVTAVYTVFLAGWGFAFAGIFYDSYLEFVGLKQAWCHVRGLPFEVSAFKTGFVFRLCRRPSFFGILVGCWATPVLTAGHAFFAAAMTAFTLVGCYFVERTYLRLYGPAYREFQSTTTLLLPRLSTLWERRRMSQGPVR